MENAIPLKGFLQKEAIKKDVSQDNIKGLFVNSVSARVHLSDYRGHEISTGIKTIKTPPDAKKVILSLGSWTFHFGKIKLENDKLSQLLIDFGVDMWEEDVMKVRVDAILRDKSGDRSWEGTFEIISLFFK